MNTVWLAFLTGLTTGGISCIAVQGGLLASSVAQRQSQQSADEATSLTVSKAGMRSVVGLFLVSKLMAYTILGFLLGLVGATFTLSPKMMGGVQIVVGLFLIATAARIADIHPIFRYVVIQPPRWVWRVMKRTSKDSSTFAPLFMGFFSVLMPCGVTQAMMAVAVASGNPWVGAAIMFSFVLGTSPIFFALGVSVMELLRRKAFAYVAGLIVAAFGILSINGGIALRGSIFTLQNFVRAATTDVKSLTLQKGQVAGISNDGKQNVTIHVTNAGYYSSVKSLKVGIPVKLSLFTNNTSGCTRAFTIPDFNISKVLPATGTEAVEFTPMKTGTLAYACGMGMYTGSFEVIP